MAALRSYTVQRQGADGTWRAVPFCQGTRDYCDGYLDAMDSLYPSAPYRVIWYEKSGIWDVYRETKGRGEVHTNGFLEDVQCESTR